MIHDNLGALMTQLSENEQKFTALILVTGEDKPGIADALFQTLAEFAVQVVDVAQLIISDRLILTVLITLYPGHQGAIAADLEGCAQKLQVDIATLFSTTNLVAQKSGVIGVSIASAKLHPKEIATLTHGLLTLNANIESITRISSSPTTIEINVSGLTLDQVSTATAAMEFEDGATIAINRK